LYRSRISSQSRLLIKPKIIVAEDYYDQKSSEEYDDDGKNDDDDYTEPILLRAFSDPENDTTVSPMKSSRAGEGETFRLS